jgi:hypothetical protein
MEHSGGSYATGMNGYESKKSKTRIRLLTFGLFSFSPNTRIELVV